MSTGAKSVTPGIPPQQQIERQPETVDYAYMAVQIPDITEVDTQLPIQIVRE